jgi:hypothetical protein
VWAEAFCDRVEGKEVDLSLTPLEVDIGGKREKKPHPDIVRIQQITKRTGKTRFSDEDISSK